MAPQDRVPLRPPGPPLAARGPPAPCAAYTYAYQRLLTQGPAFDLIDTWNGRAIGGCTYHVAHPGGRNPTVFPVNAYEAEARRVGRFWPSGHSPGVLESPPDVARLGRFFPEGHPPGPMEPPRKEINPEYPHTLDLRRSRT